MKEKFYLATNVLHGVMFCSCSALELNFWTSRSFKTLCDVFYLCFQLAVLLGTVRLFRELMFHERWLICVININTNSIKKTANQYMRSFSTNFCRVIRCIIILKRPMERAWINISAFMKQTKESEKYSCCL